MTQKPTNKPELLAPIVVEPPLCLHRWKHIPERDWVGGINGHRVKLVFYCEQCLEIATRVFER